jgi:hypothetical protein
MGMAAKTQEAQGAPSPVGDTVPHRQQPARPLEQFSIHVVGLHCERHDPAMQMEAFHYCEQLSPDLLQCALFDRDAPDARLIGIEYIISEAFFDGLPTEERDYWHPHNYEILSGTLVAPDLTDEQEHAMFRMLMNSYGKTWHVWHTGMAHEGAGEGLPLGRPMLMWSFNRDGEVDSELAEHMADHLGLDLQHKRAMRQDLVALAHPQQGVDALQGAFPQAEAAPPPGVEDARK